MPKRSNEKPEPWDLKAQREKHSYTQSQAAEILCTTQASVARWEADGTTPTIYRKYWEIYHHNQKVKAAAKKVTKGRGSETKQVASTSA